MSENQQNKYLALIKDYKWISIPVIGVILASIGISVWLLISLPEEERNILNSTTIVGTMISIVGSFASILGVIFAYLQIKEVRVSTEKTKEAVSDSIRKMNRVLMVSELSKSVVRLREIQEYFNNEQYDFGELRMKDVKPTLVQVKKDTRLRPHLVDLSYNDLFSNFCVNINTINAYNLGSKRPFSKPKINENLEDLATALIELEKELIKFE